VHDPSLEGKIRVTVIATGFDRTDEEEQNVIRPEFTRTPQPRQQVPPQPAQQAPPVRRRAVAVGGGGSEPAELPLQRFPERVVTTEQIRELDIPTFIRRQMD
jgi:hypothetical protein